MAGFRHPPGADIQRIRQDLRDRYHEGFPILKELLQNADDAGASQAENAATQCVFTLSKDGLPDAKHALLRGPGLAVINDGGFTAKDANGLTSLGLSNRADQSAAAGKFGLGLKSVFHWAEAFFYFSPHKFPGDPDTQAFGKDLLNPWSSRDTKDGRHPEWDEQWQQTQEEDFQAFKSLVTAMRVPERWFGLWIPLRRQEHTTDSQGAVRPIENSFPAANIDELLGADWQRRLAETLPLLRRVRSVRFCQRSEEGWQTVADMRVGVSARRMRFGTGIRTAIQAANNELSGRIDEHVSSASVAFRGTESINAIPALTQLRSESISKEKWPSQFTVRGDSQVWEKAEPHGAVMFTRQAAAGNPALEIHHAAFLPLGEPESVGCASSWRYNLYLHGFFFVDSGRRGILPFDELPDDATPDNAESELEVTQLWNRTLLHELVAPLVLPSLEDFILQEKMQANEIESIVSSMVRSDRLRKLTNSMCREQRFIHRVTMDGGEWARETWPAIGGKPRRWLKLPEPDFPEAELFELLPTLTHLCCNTSVSYEGKPKLADSFPEKPNDEELSGLLEAVPPTAFRSSPHLTYLLKLLPDRDGADSRLLATLVSLANGLLNEPLPEEEDLRELWNKFLQRLPVECFIRLPYHSTKANPRIVRALAETTLPVAVLWEDFRDADGKGTIGWEVLLPLLRSLAGLNLSDEAAIRQRSAIVVRMLEACESSLPPAWTDTIAKLPLFEACSPSGTRVATSIEELQEASRQGRLFTGGKEWVTDLAEAAPPLNLLLTIQDVAEMLDLGAAPCGATHCVGLLKRSPSLAEDFASRKPLLERLLENAQPGETDCWIAMRSLIHGQVSKWANDASLLGESGGHAVFAKLAGKALATVDQTWRLIPTGVVGQLALTADQQQRLNLQHISIQSIQSLIQDVGPANVDCANLSNEDCDTLLLQFNEVDVLRGLNIHESVGGERVSARHHTYVNDAAFDGLPPEFNTVITRLRDHAGYSRQFTTASETTRLVEKLNWEAVIQIALDQPMPTQWWNTILASIGRLGNLRTELRDLIRKIPWLPLSPGTAVAPSVLLHVPDADAELDRLPDSVLAGLVPVTRLKDEIQHHPSFGTFRSRILPPAREEIDLLASRLSKHSRYSTGLTGEWSAEQASEWVQTLGVAGEELAHELPIASLVRLLHGNESVQEYLPAFLKDVGGTVGSVAYVAILKHLAAGHQNCTIEARPLFEQVFMRYLNAVAACGVDFTQTVLRTDGVRLLSGGQQWKAPSLLTFATASIHADDRLDPRLEQALRLVKPTAHEQIAVLAAQPLHTSRQTDAQLANQLRQFFSRWKQADLVPDPVGAFLSLVGSGPDMLSLASDFFTTSSRRAVLDWIERMDQSGLIPLNQRLESTHFEVEIVSGPHARVASVLGTVFEARLAQEFDTLLIDDGLQVDFEQEPILCLLRLRCLPIRTEMPTDESMIAALQFVTQHVLRHALRRDVDIGPLFEELSRAHQVHVRIAQNLVVDAALAFLRQIGAQKNRDVQLVLLKWDEARRQVAEAEENRRPVPFAANKLLQDAKLELRELLATNLVTQAETLAGVRRKIREFQYTCSSIPFEVWQNADDAIIDLERLSLDSKRATELGFIVKCNPDGIAFAHWGRPINQFQGSAGLNLRSAGFDRDLEKMLVQAISDKGDAVQQGGKALTGKFGLGFKSVFLASDAPEILSGCVDFVIRGGIYPVRLEDGRRSELFSSLEAIAPSDARRGTIIRLPRRTDGEREMNELLRLFIQMAPVLVIFSRRLKRLRLMKDGGQDRELIWHPRQILGDQFEFGKLPESLGGVDNALTLLSTANVGADRLTLLLGLNSEGFAPLPSHIPTFWVTAPTRDTPDYGFAVNGSFEPDVGRVQLARESEKNKGLAKDLGKVVFSRFLALWDWTESDWETFRGELDFCVGMSKEAFWGSLWRVLGVHFADKCRIDDKSVVAELARCILWGEEAGGVQRFYTARAALPTGLWGKYRALTRIGEIQFLACGALDREVVFGIVSGWRRFQRNVAVGTICSGSHVGAVLERVGAPLGETQVIYLATVVEWELGREQRADPELASYLGELITPEFMTGLEKGRSGEREESEQRRLAELLQGVWFQAADGSWQKAGKLVVAAPQSGVEQDEPMRAAFAPRDCQLNPAYSGTALQFFLASRPRPEAGVEQMADWVLRASHQATQVAALHYLLSGDERLRHSLAKSLRAQRDPEKWLWKLGSSDWFKREFSDNQRHELLAHVLKLFEEKLREWTGAAAVEEERLDTEQQPSKHTWTVKELWKWWEQQGKPMGDYTLEGEANWELFHGGRIPDEQQRKAELKRLLSSDDPAERNPLWYRLFGYACLVSAGRHTSELRTFWKERLNPGQFWERTSCGDFSDETREVFEQAVTAGFNNMNARGEAAYFWRRVFYDIRKVRRMVGNDFPAVLLDLVNQGHGEHLRQFLRTGHLPGPDQQRWVGTFGQSADTPLGFIIRELVRLAVITEGAVLPEAFFVCRPLLRALSKIGRIDDAADGYSGHMWLDWLATDPVHGPLLQPYYDIPLLHMGITHRGDRMPVLPP